MSTRGERVNAIWQAKMDEKDAQIASLQASLNSAINEMGVQARDAGMLTAEVAYQKDRIKRIEGVLDGNYLHNIDAMREALSICREVTTKEKI
jgi:hypothetical protein